MGSGGGLGLAAVLAAAVLCGPGGLAGRVLSGECAGSAPGAGGRRGAGCVRRRCRGRCGSSALRGAGTAEGKSWRRSRSLNDPRVGGRVARAELARLRLGGPRAAAAAGPASVSVRRPGGAGRGSPVPPWELEAAIGLALRRRRARLSGACSTLKSVPASAALSCPGGCLVSVDGLPARRSSVPIV